MKAFIFLISVTLGFLFSTFSQANAITDIDGISYTTREISLNRLELDNLVITVDGNNYGLFFESIPYNVYLNRSSVYMAADLICKKIGYESAIKTGTPEKWKEQFKVTSFLKGVEKYRLAYLDNQGRIGLLSEEFTSYVYRLPVIKSVICQK